MRTKTPYQSWKRYRTTISRKGQITIPAAILRHLGWQPGTTRVLLTRRGRHLELRRIDSIVAETAGSLALSVSRETIERSWAKDASAPATGGSRTPSRAKLTTAPAGAVTR